jgi:hypothetical protein
MCSPLSGIRVLLSQGYVFSSQGGEHISLREEEHISLREENTYP